MRWLHTDVFRGPLRTRPYKFRHFSTVTCRTAPCQVARLLDWSLDGFRKIAFIPALPVLLPSDTASLPQACHVWFSQNGQTSALSPTFWTRHASTLVPLELTTFDPTTSHTTFTRSTAPLQTFLDFHIQPQNPTYSLYLAQCSLSSLPAAFQVDLPTPQIVLEAGKGDTYDTNLWIGRAPTYTPLHRDPNPNLFMQLAGSKVVRLLPPNVGRAVFDAIQEEIGEGGSTVFRGEEMMQGRERELLERTVWGGGLEDGVAHAVYEAKVDCGEALFIPKGWWHSIKGVESGITASVNWWFR